VREQSKPVLPHGRHNHAIIACAKNTLKLKARLLKQMILHLTPHPTMDRLALRSRRRRRAWGDITFFHVLFFGWQHKTIASVFGGLAMFTSVWWTPESLYLFPEASGRRAPDSPCRQQSGGLPCVPFSNNNWAWTSFQTSKYECHMWLSIAHAMFKPPAYMTNCRRGRGNATWPKIDRDQGESC
jgi:hypothetical protein